MKSQLTQRIVNTLSTGIQRRSPNLLIWLSLLLTQSQMVIGQSSDIRVHDPVVIKHDKTYHLFCTGRGIGHFTSTDLESWEKAEPVFPEKPAWTDQIVPNFRNHIWAPDIIFHQGQYYLYYSISAFGKNTSAIGVTTNKTLNPSDKNYQWIDHGIVVQSVPKPGFMECDRPQYYHRR